MADAEDETLLQFQEMGLDERVLKAISKLGWQKPTLIQEKAIPLALEGKDILARARTGSGKTAVFAIAVIQKILVIKQTASEQAVRALVLAPSKELCHQIHADFSALASSCGRVMQSVDISTQADPSQLSPLTEHPDVVIGTPSRVLAHLQAHSLQLNFLELLVIDEGDLLFSFGFENDVKTVLRYLPQIYQAILTSATLNDDIKSLKQLVLHNPVILKLQESELPSSSQLMQYRIVLDNNEKYVLLCALFKLKLIMGKTIIFVNTVDKCYKLRLFLEQFSVPSCVLNSEMPAVSRCHILTQFNQGLYNTIIASDEQTLEKRSKEKVNSKRKTDKESGVARGIDFQFVSNIINYDFPLDVYSYIHRVGRTARGNNQGTALSFVGAEEMQKMEEVETYLGEFEMSSGLHESVLRPFKFQMEEIQGFHYRARDVWQSITRIAVKEARLKEIRKEIFNSEKLKSYLEDNPRDTDILRHDKPLHTIRKQPHLKDVPDYIIPAMLKQRAGSSNWKRRKPSEQKNAKKRKFKKTKDPLQSMQFLGFKRKRRRK